MSFRYDLTLCKDVIIVRVFLDTLNNLDSCANQQRELFYSLWVAAEFIPHIPIGARDVPKPLAGRNLPEVLELESYPV